MLPMKIMKIIMVMLMRTALKINIVHSQQKNMILFVLQYVSIAIQYSLSQGGHDS